jgi:hypothetical protein
MKNKLKLNNLKEINYIEQAADHSNFSSNYK